MKDFPEGGSGNNNDGYGGDNNGGRKDNFMDQINNLKFNDDGSKDPNL